MAKYTAYYEFCKPDGFLDARKFRFDSRAKTWPGIVRAARNAAYYDSFFRIGEVGNYSLCEDTIMRVG